MNETVDEKLKIHWARLLSICSYVASVQNALFFFHLFISPLHANSRVNWLHSLQKELFPMKIQPQKKTLAEEFPSSGKTQTSTLLDSFFTNSVESPFSYLEESPFGIIPL